ncbi:hypothetical protein LMIY3S_01211 [Labrys miyagiensis]
MTEAQIIGKIAFAVWWRIGVPFALFVFCWGFVVNFLLYVLPMAQVSGLISGYVVMFLGMLTGGDMLMGDGIVGTIVVGFLRAILDNLPILVVLLFLTRWQVKRHIGPILREYHLAQRGWDDNPAP